ncbi:hypothetical protein BT69DRAFT_1235527 [Atractiella rhizophila]|nr:hypothetical protein BT69DRAFT_1235527 [Atractiella rhizophila]
MLLSSSFVSVLALAAASVSATPTKRDNWSSGKVHVVQVGGERGNIYTPEVTYAEVGDRVFFKFLTKNHTVTASSFDVPCSPLYGSFNSGFQPSQLGNGSMTGPGFVVEVWDKKPIWFHCEQGNHCEENGMVGAINPPSEGNTFDRFKNKAFETPQW